MIPALRCGVFLGMYIRRGFVSSSGEFVCGGRIMKKTCLVTGGGRSGKSAYALSLGKNAERPCFIATGWAGDEEMARRIRRHQAERSGRWSLIETRTDLGGAVREALAEKKADFILIDCLTLWVSNFFFSEEGSTLSMQQGIPEDLDSSRVDQGGVSVEDRVLSAAEELAALIRRTEIPMVLVTNEVGSGIVPGEALSRRYRDLAGNVNKIIASAVDTLVVTVCGVPLKIKGEDDSVDL